MKLIIKRNRVKEEKERNKTETPDKKRKFIISDILQS